MNPQDIPAQNPQIPEVPEVPMIPIESTTPSIPVTPTEAVTSATPNTTIEPAVSEVQADPIVNPNPIMDPVPSVPIQSSVPVPPYVPKIFNANFGNITSKPQIVHSSKKKYIIIFSALLILCAGVYSVYAFVLSPKVALPKAVMMIDSATYLHTGIKFTLSSSNASLAGTSLSIVTDLDRSMPDNIQSGTTIDIINPYASASAEIKFVDRVLYGRIVSVPNAYARYVASIGNGWYSVSLDNLMETAEKSGVTIPKKVTDGKKIGDMYEKLLSMGILKDQKFMGITKYNDVYVRQYSMEVDKEVLFGLIKSTSASGLGNPYISGMEGFVKQQLDSVMISPVIVSVGLLSGSLRGVDTGIFVSPESADDPEQNMGVLLSLTYDDSILSLAISAPQNAKSLDKMLSDYLLSKQGISVATTTSKTK